MTKARAQSRTRRKRSLWVELPILLIIAVLIAVGLRAFVVENFYIPSGSMENTLLVGDKVLANKLVYRTRDPRRGEVVVFKVPKYWKNNDAGPADSSDDDYIKRIIGVGGDHVRCCDAQQRITINNHPINEKSYLYSSGGQQDQPSDEPFDVTVPPGRLFVLGDHRSASADSRYHLSAHSGTIPVSSVVGRAFIRIWPVNRIGTLPVPSTFDHLPAPKSG